MGIEDGLPQINYGWDENVDMGVQTGPVLILDGDEVDLKLARDKQARRMAAFIAGNDLYFVTVFHPEAVLDGPFLDSLPGIVLKIGQDEGFVVSSAVNLDGGAASAWYSPTLTLKEWQPVGSWWCVKS